MHRTQISLESKQYEWLLAESRRRGVSLSALIRQMVAESSKAKRLGRDPLTAITGIAAGSGEPVGREHNHFLYGKARR
ncbi:MAG: hypothetical protein A3H35_20680 [Betaproteobacteria bacterium RIFCSPLOWO2_02_FULL_62_17]|nr:MAG: hypothetical protein A3H35_20680 [Betaproteobacteria bacterium RIFCSPLOWO2_02_FULL_62_17]